ncbi:MAG: hypothetical protein ABWY56_14215, partial [Propionibacteriaceae bacterium]
MASTQRKLLRTGAAALALALVSWPAAVAGAEDTVAFTIQDSRITESSGLARDPKAKIYWTVNDDGDEGTAYGLTPQGQVKGIVGFRAEPRDVEAVAMHDDALYVGDIGDNRSSRDFVTVYWIDNPEPDNQTVPYRAYDFSYPDGAHDAETLLVDGNGRLYIVTKGLPGGVYRAPKNPSRSEVNELKKVGTAPAFVTDGVFLPDDDKIVLRTYVSVEVLDASTYKTVARATAPLQKQGESIALSLDGGSLLLGSEGKRSSVLEIPIPTSVTDAP